MFFSIFSRPGFKILTHQLPGTQISPDRSEYIEQRSVPTISDGLDELCAVTFSEVLVRLSYLNKFFLINQRLGFSFTVMTFKLVKFIQVFSLNKRYD